MLIILSYTEEERSNSNPCQFDNRKKHSCLYKPTSLFYHDKPITRQSIPDAACEGENQGGRGLGLGPPQMGDDGPHGATGAGKYRVGQQRHHGCIVGIQRPFAGRK